MGLRRGSFCLVDLADTRGHEQAGKRPALVVSVDRFNDGPADLIVICPTTKVFYPGITTHVKVTPDRTGLRLVSYIMCEQVRVISVDRVDVPIRGPSLLDTPEMDSVETMLRMLMGLDDALDRRHRGGS